MNASVSTSARPVAADIARCYGQSRSYYWYARCKLASDPLYAAVLDVCRPLTSPLLDVGCGVGLLALYLRAGGVSVDYHGVDIDARKIALARLAAKTSGHTDVRFESGDVTSIFPSHRGSVALLDVLQYVDESARAQLIARAADCVTANGQLILRVGLNDASWRSTLTRCSDRMQRFARWILTPPRSQPTRAELIALLTANGLRCNFYPLWGRTPFNNWLLVGARSTSELINSA